jgi:hypothetical protein
MIHRHDWQDIGSNTWVCQRCEQLSGRTILVPRTDWTTIGIAVAFAVTLAAVMAVFVAFR